ncbi:MAG: class I SAM-dependent methyltransferase [Flavobacterium sp.]|uniref:class I SAM-dependent methyltransferase n=1 Tax=Flavobacterium sp. TaxID=239 RepID=UPI001B2E2E0B|nr:class I SAM-dependent methyltransferase [Flavobacterium sp.]MBO9584788.1 class I SAM-dependent methyltransferase [Flavobacterium sp.]
MEIDKKEHWETIYKTKELKEVSWYQPVPQTSLDFLKKYNIPLDAKIIDIGGGDSFLADNLLKLGYSDITVLDISEEAISKAKRRLGSDAKKVNWIVSDVTDFKPEVKYDFWHDRAAFHFLTVEKDILKYQEIAREGLAKNGILAIGTFSKTGPLKCSGIEIKQYSEQSLEERFKPDFTLIDKFTVDHNTPFGTVQNFVFGIFKIQTRSQEVDN